MNAINNPILTYGNYYIEVPKETPSCGVHPDIVHTIINNRYHLIYVWLKNNKEFWYFLIGDDGVLLDGYGWNGRSWVRTQIRIDSVKSYAN